MVKWGLPLLFALTGLIYIFVIPMEPEGVKLTFKLIPMALLMVYAWRLLPEQRRSWHWLMLAGLLFCAVGDGTIRWFVIGLSAFLIGHLFYLSAFCKRLRVTPLRVAAVIPIGIYAFLVGSQIINALYDKDETALVIPVLVYMIAISVMAWTAIMTGSKSAAFGALLFVISDSILSWNMFVSEITYSHALIMLTYYSAQFLIISSMRASVPGRGVPR